MITNYKEEKKEKEEKEIKASTSKKAKIN